MRTVVGSRDSWAVDLLVRRIGNINALRRWAPTVERIRLRKL
jgi:hypothetical protein